MSDPRLTKLLSHVRDVPDFPKPGILFKDVTPMLADVNALADCLAILTERNLHHGADVVAGIESRGFIFGAALAARLGAGFVPLRKPGKLPWRSLRETYQLEYGTDALEMHEDAVHGKRVLVVDDLLATGGTAAAAARLIERGGGAVVGFSFVIERFLPGRQALGSRPIDVLITI